MKKLQGGQKKATFDHNKRTFDDGVMKMTASASKPNQSPSPPVIGLWICWCLLALLEPVESHPSHQGGRASLVASRRDSWVHLEEHGGHDPSLVNDGFGQRLVLHRRQGTMNGKPALNEASTTSVTPIAKQPIIEATTKLISMSQQLRPSDSVSALKRIRTRVQRPRPLNRTVESVKQSSRALNNTTSIEAVGGMIEEMASLPLTSGESRHDDIEPSESIAIEHVTRHSRLNTTDAPRELTPLQQLRSRLGLNSDASHKAFGIRNRTSTIYTVTTSTAIDTQEKKTLTPTDKISVASTTVPTPKTDTASITSTTVTTFSTSANTTPTISTNTIPTTTSPTTASSTTPPQKSVEGLSSMTQMTASPVTISTTTKLNTPPTANPFESLENITTTTSKPSWRIRIENSRKQLIAFKSTTTIDELNLSTAHPVEVHPTLSPTSTVTWDFVNINVGPPTIFSVPLTLTTTTMQTPVTTSTPTTIVTSLSSLDEEEPNESLDSSLSKQPIISEMLSTFSTHTTTVMDEKTSDDFTMSLTEQLPYTTTKMLLTETEEQTIVTAKELEERENQNEDRESPSTQDNSTLSPTKEPSMIAAVTTQTTPKKGAVLVMHTLEDILQRLVPAREDSFNPFLINPGLAVGGNGDGSDGSGTSSHPSQISHDSHSPGIDRKDGRDGLNITNATGAANGSGTVATTSIYIVGVVAVIPLAGLILWIVRVQVHKHRQRLSESETSSETGFRKTRLSPVALNSSKQGRLLYGMSDKEDLVPTASKSSPWEFSRSRLRLQTLIGEGNFGQVWKAEAEDICGCQGTLLVAVKTVKDGAATKEKQELLREMRIMQQLGPHPNVVALLGCCTEQEPFLLIMEYVMYGRLLTFLRDHRSHQTYYNFSNDSEALTSRDLTTFAYCVAKGMEYIAAKGIVHRDLAARNVLVDHNKLCKVADFGLSRDVRDSAGEMYEQRVKGALPIRWMAPESLVHSVFTQKSDVWSFGILVWEIVTLGSTPYPGIEAREVMRRVKDGHRLERPNHCRPEFYRLMSRCWHNDPVRRPEFNEIKADLGRLLDDVNGYIDLDNFQESIYIPLESPTDESEKV